MSWWADLSLDCLLEQFKFFKFVFLVIDEYVCDEYMEKFWAELLSRIFPRLFYRRPDRRDQHFREYLKLNVVRRIVSTNGFALTIPAKFVVNGIHQEWNRRIWTFLWSFCFPRLMGKLSNCQGRVEGGAAGKVHFPQFWTGVSSARLWQSGLVGFIGKGCYGRCDLLEGSEIHRASKLHKGNDKLLSETPTCTSSVIAQSSFQQKRQPRIFEGSHWHRHSRNPY